MYAHASAPSHRFCAGAAYANKGNVKSGINRMLVHSQIRRTGGNEDQRIDWIIVSLYAVHFADACRNQRTCSYRLLFSPFGFRCFSFPRMLTRRFAARLTGEREQWESLLQKRQPQNGECNMSGPSIALFSSLLFR